MRVASRFSSDFNEFVRNKVSILSIIRLEKINMQCK